jgi:subtilisin family serine protease
MVELRSEGFMKTVLLILFITINCQAKNIRVAVIDTGLNSIDGKVPLCKEGHKSFVSDGLPFVDHHGHGTNIANLIKDNSNALIKGRYCLVILKFYDPLNNGSHNLERMIAAIKYATKLKVDVINISGGGTDFSSEERTAIERALNLGIKIVAAAGNERSNLKYKPYYPASYDHRIYVIGSTDPDGKLSEFSNYGDQVYQYEMGEDVLAGKYKMSGTSQATAIFTGKFLLDVYNAKNGLECIGRSK